MLIYITKIYARPPQFRFHQILFKFQIQAIEKTMLGAIKKEPNRKGIYLLVIREEKKNLSGDSGTSAVEEVVKIPGDSIGQNGEGVVGGATCNLDEEGEEEHVGDGEGSFDNLTEGAMSEAKVVEDDDPKENTGPYPHERQNEV